MLSILEEAELYGTTLGFASLRRGIPGTPEMCLRDPFGMETYFAFESSAMTTPCRS
jgi:hypothetical protein